MAKHFQVGDIVLTASEKKIGSSHSYRTHRKHANKTAVVRHIPGDLESTLGPSLRGLVRLSVDDGDCLWPLKWLTPINQTDHIRYGNRIRRELGWEVGDKAIVGRPLDGSETDPWLNCFYGVEGTITSIQTDERTRRTNGGRAIAEVKFKRADLKSDPDPGTKSEDYYWVFWLESLEPVATGPEPTATDQGDNESFTPLVVESTAPDQESKKPMTIKIPLPSLGAVAFILFIASMFGLVAVAATGGFAYTYTVDSVKPLNSDGLLYVKMTEKQGYFREWLGAPKSSTHKYLRMGSTMTDWFQYENKEQIGENTAEDLEEAYNRFVMSRSVEVFEAAQKEEERKEAIEASYEELQQAARMLEQMKESFPEE